MISVGIDVSKEKSTVFILSSTGEINKEAYEIFHNSNDIHNLVKTIKGFNEPVKVVLESTGYYHWPIVNTLISKNIFVAIINPIVMSRFSKQKLRQGKTDPLDAAMIARFGLAYWNNLICYTPKDSVYEELNTYSRQYYQYIQLKTKAKINLTSLIDKTLPGIKKLIFNNNGKLNDFIAKWWHFECITKNSFKVFSNQYNKWSNKKGYRMSTEKAEELYAIAQNGITTLPCNEATKILIMEALKTIKYLEKSLDVILTHMNNLASTLPEYSMLLQMNCIGPTLAVRLISEIGDIRRFHSKNSLIAYAGIDAPPYQSGNFESHNRHISKRGNKYLRRTGYELMMSFAQHKPSNDKIYDFISKKRAEGKYYLTAYIAGFNKFLRIYYARVNELYNTKQT